MMRQRTIEPDRYNRFIADINAAKDACQRTRSRIQNDLQLTSQGKADQIAAAERKRDEQINTALAALRNTLDVDRVRLKNQLKESPRSADEWAELQYHHTALAAELNGVRLRSLSDGIKR